MRAALSKRGNETECPHASFWVHCFASLFKFGGKLFNTKTCAKLLEKDSLHCDPAFVVADFIVYFDLFTAQENEMFVHFDLRDRSMKTLVLALPADV